MKANGQRETHANDNVTSAWELLAEPCIFRKLRLRKLWEEQHGKQEADARILVRL